eukprot:6188761-Amphidinium_carterae.1
MQSYTTAIRTGFQWLYMIAERGAKAKECTNLTKHTLDLSGSTGLAAQFDKVMHPPFRTSERAAHIGYSACAASVTLLQPPRTSSEST